jgi:hypothetical protein
MSIFGLFKSPTFTDPELGEFTFRGGLWRGTLTLPGHAPVPLALSGSKTAPDVAALAAARQLPADYAAWQPAIEKALLEHREPYAESDENVPPIGGPADLWRQATPQYVAVALEGGAVTVDLGYDVAWDEEHTVAACFRGGRLVELNGSLPAP